MRQVAAGEAAHRIGAEARQLGRRARHRRGLDRRDAVVLDAVHLAEVRGVHRRESPGVVAAKGGGGVGADDLVEQREKRRQQQRPRRGRRRGRRRRRAGGGRDRRAIGLDEARGVGAAALAAIAQHPRCVLAPGDDRVQRGRPRQRVGQRRDDRREGRRGPEAIQRQLDLRVEEQQHVDPIRQERDQAAQVGVVGLRRQPVVKTIDPEVERAPHEVDVQRVDVDRRLQWLDDDDQARRVGAGELGLEQPAEVVHADRAIGALPCLHVHLRQQRRDLLRRELVGDVVHQAVHARALVEAPLRRWRLGAIQAFGLAEDRIEEIDLAVVAVDRPDLVEDALVAGQRGAATRARSRGSWARRRAPPRA